MLPGARRLPHRPVPPQQRRRRATRPATRCCAIQERPCRSWLQRAGYRTGFVGKYLNGYELKGGAEPAPGWDRWVQIQGYADYFGYAVSDDGAVSTVRHRVTRLLDPATHRARRSVHAGPRPATTPSSSGSPTTPPTRSLAAIRRPATESSPSHRPTRALPAICRRAAARARAFDEGDAPTRAAGCARRGRSTDGAIETMTKRWRCGLAALRAVDGGFRRLVAEPRRERRAGDTLVVFLSDNGYFFGEHRIADDKRLPYEPARGCHSRSGAGRRRPAARLGRAGGSNVDLAPTLLDLARARPCVGRRLPAGPTGARWRPCSPATAASGRRTARVLLELDDGFTYSAIRTPGYLYAEMTADRRGACRAPKPSSTTSTPTRASSRTSPAPNRSSSAISPTAWMPSETAPGTTGKAPCE